MAQPAKRQWISEYASLEFAEVGFDDSPAPLHGLMHFFVALWTLGTTWCVAWTGRRGVWSTRTFPTSRSISSFLRSASESSKGAFPKPASLLRSPP